MSGSGNVDNIAYWKQIADALQKLGVAVEHGKAGNFGEAGTKTGGLYEQAQISRPGVAPSKFNGGYIEDMRTSSGATGVRKFYTKNGTEGVQFSDGSVQLITPNKNASGETTAGLSKVLQGVVIAGNGDVESDKFLRDSAALLKAGETIRFQKDEKLGRITTEVYDSKNKRWNDVGIGTTMFKDMVEGARSFYYDAGKHGAISGAGSVGVSEDIGFVESDALHYDEKERRELDRTLERGGEEDTSSMGSPRDKKEDKRESAAEERSRREERTWRASISAMMLLNSSIGKLGGGFDSLSRAVGGAVSGGNVGAAFGPIGAGIGAVVGMLPEAVSFFNKVMNSSSLVMNAAAQSLSDANARNAPIDVMRTAYGLDSGVVAQMMKIAPGVGMTPSQMAGKFGSTLSDLNRGVPGLRGKFATFLGDNTFDEKDQKGFLKKIVARANYLHNKGSMRTEDENVVYNLGKELLGGEMGVAGYAAMDIKELEHGGDVVSRQVDDASKNKIASEAAKARTESVKNEQIRRLQKFTQDIDITLSKGSEKEAGELLDKRMGETIGRKAFERNKEGYYAAATSSRVGLLPGSGWKREHYITSNKSDLLTAKRLAEAKLASLSGDKEAFKSNPAYEWAMGQTWGGRNTNYDQQREAIRTVEEGSASSDKDTYQKFLRGELDKATALTLIKRFMYANEGKFMLPPGLLKNEASEKLGETDDQMAESFFNLQQSMIKAKKDSGMLPEASLSEVLDYLPTSQFGNSSHSFTDGSEEAIKQTASDMAAAFGFRRDVGFNSSVFSSIDGTNNAAISGANVEATLPSRGGFGAPGEEASGMTSAGPVIGDMSFSTDVHIDGTLSDENRKEFAKEVGEAVKQQSTEMIVDALRKAAPYSVWMPM